MGRAQSGPVDDIYDKYGADLLGEYATNSKAKTLPSKKASPMSQSSPVSHDPQKLVQQHINPSPPSPPTISAEVFRITMEERIKIQSIWESTKGLNDFVTLQDMHSLIIKQNFDP